MRRIAEYSYHIEIAEQLPYDEVTEIFIRVNSRGRSLRTSDLALATLSARWPGVVAKLERETEGWQTGGYAAIDVTFLTKAVAAATDARSLAGLSTTPVADIVDGWARTQKGLQHLVPLLKRNAHIETSTLLPSATP